MSKALSQDLRERIVAAYTAGDVSQREVAERFEVSHSVVGKLVRQQRHEGSLQPHTDRCGRKRAISGETEDALRDHLREHPEATLEERREALGLTCTLKTVWLSLKRLTGRFKKSHPGRPNRSVPTWSAPAATGRPASRRSIPNR